MTRAGKAEWADAPEAGLSACGVEGSAARMRRCAQSGDISAARLHRPPLSGYTDSRSALRAESRIYGDTELWIYGKKVCDAGGKDGAYRPREEDEIWK